MEVMSKFQNQLRELMLEHDNIKSTTLAAVINVNVTTVCAWLRGALLPSLANAIKLADYFTCSLDYLVGRTDNDETVLPRPLPPFYPHLREIMKTLGVSRYEIANNSSIKDPFFTNWAKGERPNLISACTLADYLKVSLDYLIGRRDY